MRPATALNSETIKARKLEIVDEQTFKVKFEQPYVYFLEILAKDSTGDPSLDRPSFVFPKHYLKQLGMLKKSTSIT